MKINKTKMIISTAIIFLPTLLCLIFSGALSEQMAIHWGPDGQPDGFSSPLYFSIIFPTILAALQWLCVYITIKTNDTNEQNKKVTEIVYWICPAISIYSTFVVYSVALGYDVNIYSLMCMFFGALFIIMGNYIPKCKQNSTMGIKIKWTLTNEENWNATHRFAGKVWFWIGFAYFPLAFLPIKACAIVAVLSMIVSGNVPTIYSYLYYKKQLSKGVLTKEDFKYPKLSKKARVISSIAITFTIVFLIIIMFTGNINITHTDNSLTIKATFWENITLSYSDIANIEYSETNAPGQRLNGFASSKLMLGWFSSDVDGNHTRYTYTTCKSAIIITTNEGKKVIFNKSDDKQTKALYEEIIPRLEKSEET